MKITREQESPKFQPIKLNITIETEEELVALKSLSSCERSTPMSVCTVIQDRKNRGDREWDLYKPSVLTDILIKINRML